MTRDGACTLAPMVDSLREALHTLTHALTSSPELSPELHARWRRGLKAGKSSLPAELAAAADYLDATLPRATKAELGAALSWTTGEMLFVWAAAHAGRTDALLAPLLIAAAEHDEHRERARIIARNRIVQGPLRDALACAPLLGAGNVLRQPESLEALARMEILVWEAGACALQLPALGQWIWSSRETFETAVATPARGTLRGRVLAARTLEVAASGLSAATSPELVGRTLQVLQPLLLHPEPMVWIHAARSFGRLAGVLEPLEGTLLDWVHGGSQVLRQRALTAFASLPADRLAVLGHELESILDAPSEKAWGLAAAAAATPYLFHERRKVWDRLATRIVAGDGGAIAARALGRGLATLWRRADDRDAVRDVLRQLRQLARSADAETVEEWRHWLDLLAATDPIDEAERDPLDLETGIENLARLAAQYDDEEADARAARFAATLLPTFSEARRILLGAGSLRQRAAAMNAVEGCARSLALRLWSPMLATRPLGEALSEPDLEETWATFARAPSELLDVVRSRRREAHEGADSELALEILALKLGSYALDACGEEHHVGPSRGETAHATCLWLRKLEGLADGARAMPTPLRSALSALFWRLVDTTRGTSLGEVDDVAWLGPFAAWWALVIDRPAILSQLAAALPVIAEGALETCCVLADETRAALTGGAPDGRWGDAVADKLTALRADETELAGALTELARTLGRFADTAGPRSDLERQCVHLVLAAERLREALSDPVRALHAPKSMPPDEGLAGRATADVSRTASVVSRAIRLRDISLLEVWFASLGVTTAALVEAAVRGAIRRTPPPPPTPPKKRPTTVVGYELVKALGEGGIGSVWLVRKPDADRLFVLKIPKADVLKSASDAEREAILSSFRDEAQALAGLYHPNVANIIDRGVDGDVPYLVLEYLIGADLKQYAGAKPMSLFELRKVVLETCTGLTALHGAGLVHRDIKPANLWLRLPLAGGEPFDPSKHRDPGTTTPLSTVIIDFGMVRAEKVSAEVGGRFVAGTPGYIAPEQVLDPVALDGRADVFALAGTLYNVTTGRTFFDDIADPRARIVAHMHDDPMEDEARFRSYPAALVRLMRAATAKSWRDRPSPAEFAREFAAIV